MTKTVQHVTTMLEDRARECDQQRTEFYDGMAAGYVFDRHADDGLPAEELMRRIQGKQGIVSQLTDRFTPAVLDKLPDLRVISNVAVGSAQPVLTQVGYSGRAPGSHWHARHGDVIRTGGKCRPATSCWRADGELTLRSAKCL